MALKRWMAGVAMAVWCAGAVADPGEVFFVDKDNTSGVENGLTWATAATSLQAGIEIARRNFGGDVWVAAGVYDVLQPADGSLLMRENVNVYGGFTGTEAAFNQRDPALNITVIDGSRSLNGGPTEHVVLGEDNARLDGFTIQGGRGENGAGIFNVETSPVIANCVISDNLAERFGGGVMNVNGASAQFIGCRFQGNRAGESGGAVANTAASPTFIECVFIQNEAELAAGAIFNTPGSDAVITSCEFRGNAAQNGGAIFTDQANPYISKSQFFDNEAENFGGAIFNNQLSDNVITNCVFARNIAQTGRGGAIANQESGLFLLNCTVTENQASGTGGGIFCNGRQLLVLNSIIWENVPRQFDIVDAELEVNYSDIDGAISGQSNINFNPRFRDPAHDDFSLQPQSRCINAGTAQTAPEDDLADTARPQGNGIDMGAYEATDIGTPEPLPVGCPAGSISPGGWDRGLDAGPLAIYATLMVVLLGLRKRKAFAY